MTVSNAICSRMTPLPGRRTGMFMSALMARLLPAGRKGAIFRAFAAKNALVRCRPGDDMQRDGNGFHGSTGRHAFSKFQHPWDIPQLARPVANLMY